ncbi:lipopolysaccharide biosynthesis glycosyltransferase [Dysgonomonas sp. PFB1-18]|uniref:glycosyltransferase family 8 protein n=1 Tax=unclassified Dysgonomonas TaxID=2630389 RepID=UPI0024745EB9|nr:MULTISPECIES: glycosyltransferase family 8 protein [unclassified Dysgonomonas]MDH6308292.1 lipopolysaccharide biosynthesis glycosyltransferase [Dysgonomonas sp. PF1-14]MDH6338270.1 lipopolysaccharide biosynthesis glycosyltransferase [Dysgonomonas sp. PF1-16]MDH6379767.1 lipopolysaccharide biosynthesis glycosyltransferase [Dysgonomonas sp. PFB1-18]MDH6397143.1 lipopolysaccharide biosynthesis glycosyltransferase [Dysgonomonas sp. PF1-23]
MEDSTNVIPIVICGDKNVEIGLHVTLFSLLSHSTGSFHNIYFINKGYNDSDLNKLNNSLSQFRQRYEVISVPYMGDFEGLKSLHGNKFAYAKLLIPELVGENKVIYLDLDILVNTDIVGLYNLPLYDYIVAAVIECRMSNTLEKTLYNSLEIDMNAAYFNSGIMVIDCKRWRENRITEKCLEFAEQHSDKLKTADQTVLNYYFYNNFQKLPHKFNIMISNRISYKEYALQEGIYHFYGRPKPWDLFAEFIHPQYELYKGTLNKTIFNEYRSYKNITKISVRKMLKTYKSYIKVLFKL